MRNKNEMEVFLKTLVLTGKECSFNFSHLNPYCDELTILFKNIEEAFDGPIPYDAVLVDESYLTEFSNFRLIEKLATITTCFILLDEETSYSLNDLLEMGAKDVFIKPISFKELGLKINRYDIPECPQLLKLAGLGVTLKQIQIHQILKSKGFRGAERYDILKHIWKKTTVDPRNVDVQIWSLRKVLRNNNIGDIKNVNNRWYLVN